MDKPKCLVLDGPRGITPVDDGKYLHGPTWTCPRCQTTFSTGHLSRESDICPFDKQEKTETPR